MFEKDCGPYFLLFLSQRTASLFTGFVCKGLLFLLLLFACKGLRPLFSAIRLQRTTVLVYCCIRTASLFPVSICKGLMSLLPLLFGKDRCSCFQLFVCKGLLSSFPTFVAKDCCLSFDFCLQRAAAPVFFCSSRRSVVLVSAICPYFSHLIRRSAALVFCY